MLMVWVAAGLSGSLVVEFGFEVAPVEDSNNKSMYSSFLFVSKLTDMYIQSVQRSSVLYSDHYSVGHTTVSGNRDRRTSFVINVCTNKKKYTNKTNSSRIK